MIPGINQWSLPIADQDLVTILSHTVQAKIPHVELCIEPIDHTYFENITPDPELDALFFTIADAVNAEKYVLKLLSATTELDYIKDSFSKAGAKIVSVTTLDLFRYTITSESPEIREAAEFIIKKMVDICEYLGGVIVLIEPGVVTSTLSYQEAYKNCLLTMKKLAKYAEERNITLALENVWGKFLLSPLEFRDFIDEINSDAVGVYFDVANILEYGYPQDWIRIIGNRIKSIHFKDYQRNIGARGFCNPFDGEIDWQSVRDALRDINYSSFIVAEAIRPKTWQYEFISELGNKMQYFISKM